MLDAAARLRPRFQVGTPMFGIEIGQCSQCADSCTCFFSDNPFAPRVLNRVRAFPHIDPCRPCGLPSF